MIIKVEIPEQFIYLMQEAELNYIARKDVLKEILMNDNINISNERFEIYQKELEQKNFIYNRFKNELEKLYIYPNINDDTKLLSWAINYSTNILTIEVENK